jgi:hypothetical protein
MKIGFTGTRNGMTLKQKLKVAEIIRSNIPIEAHHGMCKGADEDFHHIIRGVACGARIVSHPSNIKEWTSIWIADENRMCKPPLERNHDIVDETDILIACPKSDLEELRSGTWATIRYAKKKNKKLYLINP